MIKQKPFKKEKKWFRRIKKIQKHKEGGKSKVVKKLLEINFALNKKIPPTFNFSYYKINNKRNHGQVEILSKKGHLKKHGKNGWKF